VLSGSVSLASSTNNEGVAVVVADAVATATTAPAFEERKGAIRNSHEVVVVAAVVERKMDDDELARVKSNGVGKAMEEEEERTKIRATDANRKKEEEEEEEEEEEDRILSFQRKVVLAAASIRKSRVGLGEFCFFFAFFCGRTGHGASAREKTRDSSNHGGMNAASIQSIDRSNRTYCSTRNPGEFHVNRKFPHTEATVSFRMCPYSIPAKSRMPLSNASSVAPGPAGRRAMRSTTDQAAAVTTNPLSGSVVGCRKCWIVACPVPRPVQRFVCIERWFVVQTVL
jgi:hypothetical protein